MSSSLALSSLFSLATPTDFVPISISLPMPTPQAPLPPELIVSPLASRGSRRIPEMDQIFTEVEMTTLERVINETWVIPV